MAKKYAVYVLTKVPHKKEYVVSKAYIFNSLKAAYEDLAIWDEDYDEPVGLNRKTGEFVAYELHDSALYVPNWEAEEKGGRLLGVYSRFPVYYIDVYPNPYNHYTIKGKRTSYGCYELLIEGVK